MWEFGKGNGWWFSFRKEESPFEAGGKKLNDVSGENDLHPQ